MVAIRGHFDGKVFVPDEPVTLPRNQRVILHVEMPDQSQNNVGSVWAILDQHQGSIEAPKDWSEQHDHYLYGTPKQPKDSNS